MIDHCLLNLITKPVSGVTYTRWGKSSCPNSTGVQLVYSGRAGGTHYLAHGGAAEMICIPDNPDYIPETSGVTVTHYSIVRGAEYEFFVGPLANVTEHNAPCAVCYVPNRATTIMIPAKTMCPSGWTREYYGYLTTGAELTTHQRQSYTCLDIAPGVVEGTSANTNPTLFYYTIANCDGLSCPPFETGRILACAVCTK